MTKTVRIKESDIEYLDRVIVGKNSSDRIHNLLENHKEIGSKLGQIAEQIDKVEKRLNEHDKYLDNCVGKIFEKQFKEEEKRVSSKQSHTLDSVSARTNKTNISNGKIPLAEPKDDIVISTEKNKKRVTKIPNVSKIIEKDNLGSDTVNTNKPTNDLAGYMKLLMPYSKKKTE